MNAKEKNELIKKDWDLIDKLSYEIEQITSNLTLSYEDRVKGLGTKKQELDRVMAEFLAISVDPTTEDIEDAKNMKTGVIILVIFAVIFYFFLQII